MMNLRRRGCAKDLLCPTPLMGPLHARSPRIQRAS